MVTSTTTVAAEFTKNDAGPTARMRGGPKIEGKYWYWKTTRPWSDDKVTERMDGVADGGIANAADEESPGKSENEDTDTKRELPTVTDSCDAAVAPRFAAMTVTVVPPVIGPEVVDTNTRAGGAKLAGSTQ